MFGHFWTFFAQFLIFWAPEYEPPSPYGHFEQTAASGCQFLAPLHLALYCGLTLDPEHNLDLSGFEVKTLPFSLMMLSLGPWAFTCRDDPFAIMDDKSRVQF